MQNIPDIASDSAAEQYRTLRTTVTTTDTDQSSMFDSLLQMHSAKVENELALAPVATSDKMVEAAPETTSTASSTSTTARESVAQSHKSNTAERQNPRAEQAKTEAETDADTTEAKAQRDRKMTREDLDKVKENLKGYGFSDKEIKDLEDRIDSDEGLTWNQFVTAMAEKMAALRKVTLTDDQKTKLTSFFSKLGFNETQSARLISQMEKGETGKVMSALKARVDALPESKQLLLTADEVTAFTSAMQFSEGLTGQLKELLGQSATGKNLKQAFALMTRETEALDAKDNALVQAVGKAFAEATGSEVKASSTAADLKPRTADDNGADTMVKEDLKDAMKERRDSLPESNAKNAETKSLPTRAETATDARTDTQEQKTESNDADKTWRDFFSKLRDDTSASTRRTEVKGGNADQALSNALSNAAGKTSGEAAVPRTAAPKVLRQVENAVFKTLNNGAKQLTLQLSPENLGKISVTLQVHGKEVSAQIRAESAESAKLIHDNIDVIKQALQDQGLKVDKLDVQTGLADSQSGNNWFGQEEHNMTRDREAMAAMRNHLRAMRGESFAAQAPERQSTIPTPTDGLHLVA